MSVDDILIEIANLDEDEIDQLFEELLQNYCGYCHKALGPSKICHCMDDE